MKYLLNGRLYDCLKWLCLIAFPAFSALYSALAGMWNLPYPVETVGTVNAVGVFVGALIGVSQVTAVPRETDQGEQK